MITAHHGLLFLPVPVCLYPHRLVSACPGSPRFASVRFGLSRSFPSLRNFPKILLKQASILLYLVLYDPASSDFLPVFFSFLADIPAVKRMKAVKNAYSYRENKQ
ncbi:MAG: hypothetical protein HDT26_06550 [Subdoligranulum sp.]|nr:hypothetical protein [Subdoligranulum sp.]